MTRSVSLLSGLVALLCAVALPVLADDSLPDRILGRRDAPITVEEYVSMTCPHCAEFYIKDLPELEKTYVDTGKVRFILRDFPLDGVALKAAVVARCMPEDEYYPFIKTLYGNMMAWANAQNVDQALIQYAKLGGLSEANAKTCLQDQVLQDRVIAERTKAAEKLNIQATPTFVINYGVEKLQGAQTVAQFSAVFDRLLAAKK